MFNRKLLSIVITSVLLTSTSVVSANTQNTDVEDSVKSWGQWSKQYATAAGGEINTNTLVFADLVQKETGRNSQNEIGLLVEPVLGVELPHAFEGLCGENDPCGITSFYAHNPLEGETRQFSTGSTGIKVMNNLAGGQVIIYDDDGSELYRHSRGNNAGQSYYQDINRTMSVDGAYSSLGFDNMGNDGVVEVGIWYETEGEYAGFAWGSSVEEGSVWPLNGIGGFYVAGVLSDLGDVEQIARGVNLTFTGQSYNNTDVTINLDMRAQTWDASFVAQDVIYEDRYRNTSFEVTNGTIDGFNLKATTDQLSPGVTGQVQAAFFGNRADKIGGVVDVVKEGKSYTDAFVTDLVVER